MSSTALTPTQPPTGNQQEHGKSLLEFLLGKKSSVSNLAEEGIPGEEEKMRKDLTADEQLQFVRAIAGLSSDDVSAVIRAADDALPEDVALNPKLLRATLHPGKFGDADKQQAEIAFQRKSVFYQP